ncbi:MAG TPA: sensor histidine kinase [Puia sp.]|jgi:two-component sensor histidine kinase
MITLFLFLGLAFTGYWVTLTHNRKLHSQKKALNLQNHHLRLLLNEKEWLIKEIHHRVTNNLQIVISLLNTQCEFIDNPPAMRAIQDSRERLQAIAIIHQKLYRTDEQDSLIGMRMYIDEMIFNLKDSYTSKSDSICIRKDVDDLELDLAQAVPIGLLLNEAVTNCVKYAFPKEKKGIIDISLLQQNDGKILLRIADDGPGLPVGLHPEECKSLGLRLIQLLAQQLKGDLKFISGPGLEITMLFSNHRSHSSFLHRHSPAFSV